MMRIKWPVALATLFVVLLGWYLVYTASIVSQVRQNSQLLSRMFVEVQEGIITEDSGRQLQALVNLQSMVTGSGVPLVLMGPGDIVLDAVNLPFEADPDTDAGQARIRAYVRRLDLRNPPVGDSTAQHIHYGDTPEVENLRWIPWLQAGGLLLTVFVGFTVIRYQRRAESEKAWTSMARELAHQLGTPLSSLAGWLEVLRLAPAERPGGRGRILGGALRRLGRFAPAEAEASQHREDRHRRDQPVPNFGRDLAD